MNTQGRDALSSLPLKTPIRRSLDRLIGVFKELSATPVNQLKVRKSTPRYRKAILVIAVLFVPLGVLFGTFNASHPTASALSPNKTLNFQGRLLSNTGALVADGYYNMEFKLYNATTSGNTPNPGACTMLPGTTADTACLWTEVHYDHDGAAPIGSGDDYRVRVTNGYYSVVLGDTGNGGVAFPSTMDWTQQLYLSMRVGGNNQTATPTWDTEMTPRIQTTAVPLAITALTAINVNSGNTSTASTSSANNLVQSGDATGATSNSGTLTVATGTATGFSGALTVQTGNATGNSGDLKVDVGTSGATAGSILIGTVNNTSGITIGSTTLANAITVGQSTASNTINIGIGNTLTGNTQAINIGTGTPAGTGQTNINIGNILNAGALNLKAGTGSIKLSGVATGTSATFLGLPVKTDPGDPTTTQVNGAIYYNSSSGTFRCYQNSAWVDCIGAGGTGITNVGTLLVVPTAANGASVSGSNLILQYADGSFPGLVSTVAQIIAGSKTFTGTTTVFKNTSDSVSALQVQNLAGTAILTADTLNSRVGIGTSVPLNSFGVSPLQYATGTASQTASTTVVGVGTTFTAAMVGSQIVYADGVSDIITAFNDTTHITVNTSRTHTSSAFSIFYQGLQVKSDGTVYTQGSSSVQLTAKNVYGANVFTVGTDSSAITVGSTGTQSLFKPKVDYTSGNNPTTATSADFNNDGKIDIAVTNYGANTFSIFINQGSGLFAAKVDYATGASTSPDGIATGDFNKDGFIDIATVNNGNNTVAIFFNNGSGVFTIQASPPVTGLLADYIVSGDFDKDGDIDLAVSDTSSSANAISILLNNGTGTFAAKVDYPTVSQPGPLTLGDFNKDGVLDIATTLFVTNKVGVLLGIGNGTFGTKVDYPVTNGPQGVISGDFNKDGSPDLAVVNQGSNTVSVLLGLGNGAFGTKVDYATASTPVKIVTGDINKDGNLDLMVTSAGGGNIVSVLLGNSNGTFSAKIDYTAALGLGGISAADYNNDGNLDLSSTGSSGPSLTVMINAELGVTQTTNPSLSIYNNSVNDALSIYGQSTSQLLRVDGQGNTTIGGSSANLFDPKVDYSAGSTPQAITTGDFNKDGILDIASTESITFNTNVSLGLGNGTFGPKVAYYTANFPVGITSGDFNKDGNLDLAVANSDNVVSIFMGIGNGTFGARTDFNSVGSSPQGITTGDFNGDGKLDLAITNFSSATISIILNSGLGTTQFGTSPPTFTTLVSYTVGTNPTAISTGDFNGDGKLDLAIANAGSLFISVLINSGLGTGQFGASPPAATTLANYTTSSIQYGIVTGDFNKDGKLDIAATNNNSITMSIFINSAVGTGQFGSGANPITATTRVDYSTGTSPRGIIAGDFNKDGTLDIAVTNTSSNTVSIFTNSGLGSGQFGASPPVATSKTDYTTGSQPLAIITGDFNNDNDLDLAVINTNSATFSVLSGTTVANNRLRVMNTSGTGSLFDLSNSGLALKNIINSSAAFQIQNSIGSAVLNVDTTTLNTLTSNTSFEGALTGWTANGTNASVQETSAQAYAATNSLLFTTGTAANNSARYNIGAVLATSTTYTFSFYARLASGSMSLPNPLTIAYARDGTTATQTDCAVYNATTIITSGGWTRVSCTINTDGTAPASTAYLAIKQLDTTSRSLYIDSLQLEAGTAITQAQIGNTGFETAGVAAPWTKTGSGAPVNMTLDTTTGYNGANSLKMTVLTPGGRDGTSYITANTNPTQLNIDSSYTLSFWAKASAAFSTFTAGYERDGVTVSDCKTSLGTVTTNWSRFSCTITTDNTAPAAGAFIYIVQTDLVTRNWWIDDVQLTNNANIVNPVAYQDSSISFNGIINTSTLIRNKSDSTNALQVQNAAGTSLLTADTLNGVVSVGGAPTLTQLSSVTTAATPWGLVVVGDYAYTINNGTSFQITNMSTSSVASTTAVPLASSLNGIYISGNYAYLVDETVAKIFIYDISNPFAPVLKNGSAETTYQTNASVWVQGNYAYVVGSTGMQIFDITNPVTPVSLSTTAMSASYSIVLKGKYVYVAGGGASNASTLKIVDISNPFSPVIVSTSTQVNMLSLYVQGKYVYATDGGIVRILDVSNPTATPVQVGTLYITNNDYLSRAHWGMPYSIFVKGRYAYVAGADNKIYTIDISTPSLPVLTATTTNGSSTDNIYIQGSYLYTTDYTGAAIYQYAMNSAGSVIVNNTVQAYSGSFTSDLSIGGALNISSSTTDAFRVGSSSTSTVLSVDTSVGNLNNVITNASIETDTTGWAAKGTTPTTFAREPNKGYSGSSSLKVTTQATIDQGAIYNVSLPSGRWTASLYIMLDSTSKSMSTLAVGYAKDGVTDGNCNINTSTLRAGQWVRVTCSFFTLAPSGTPYFYVKQTDANIHTFYIDGVTLQTDANSDANYREGKISLGGTITSPVTLQNSFNSANALTVQNAAGTNIFNIDTTDSNIITNPGFEVNLLGWGPELGGALPTRETSQAWLGTASLGEVTSATANSGARFITGNVQPTQLAISTTYTLSWYAKLSSGTFTDIKGRYSVDGGTTFIDCTPTGGLTPQVVNLNGWTRYVCSFTTAVTTPSATAYIAIVQTAATAHTFWIDGVQLEAAATASEYAAGSLFINATITSPTVFKNTSNSTEEFKIQNAAATNLLTVDSLNGNVVVGVQDANTTPLVLDWDTDATFLNGSTGATAGTEVDGGMFYSSTDHRAMCGIAGSWLPCNGLLYSNTAASGSVSTCLATCASIGTAPVPANFCKPGKTIHIFASGVYNTTAAVTVGMGVYYGTDGTTRTNDGASPIGIASVPVSSGAAAVNLGWHLDYYIICYSTTTMMGQGYFSNATTTTTSTSVSMYTTTATTVVSTSAKNLYLFPAFGASAAGNNITMEQYIVTGN